MVHLKYSMCQINRIKNCKNVGKPNTFVFCSDETTYNNEEEAEESLKIQNTASCLQREMIWIHF